MVSIKDIPAEVRWEIAAKSATAMSFAYGAFLERALGDKSDEIVKQIWTEGGKEAKGLAEKLALPTGDAIEVDETWGVLTLILYGPEFTWETQEEGKDRAVDRITGCPFLNRHREMGSDSKGLFETCQAYSRSVVEGLNSKYTQRFESAMCQGAPYCESIVELKKK
jgi:hypothetical protein